MSLNLSIVNLTGKDIVFLPADYIGMQTNPISDENKALLLSKCFRIKSSGLAVCEMSRESEERKIVVDWQTKKIQTSVNNVGVVSNLPNPVEGTIYIVPIVVYNAYFHTRKDIYMIDKVVKDKRGSIFAARSFSRPFYDEHVRSIQPTLNYLSKRFTESTDPIERDEIQKHIVSLTVYTKK